MDGQLAGNGNVLVWREEGTDEAATRVFVRDLGTGEVAGLDAYDGFEVLDVSTDGDLVALRGPWGIKRNNNVAELVVLRWRSNERVFASKDHLYFRALFDNAGSRALVEIDNKKNVCID